MIIVMNPRSSVYFLLHFVLCPILVCESFSCADRSQAEQLPQYLNETAVVLMLTTIDSDVSLPCHYCDQRLGVSGRIWRRKDLHGKVMEVRLDMHDDDSKNRVFVDKEHKLVIRKVHKSDAAYYFCYDIEEANGTPKMEVLLDVSSRTLLEPEVLRNPVDLKTAILPVLKDCELLENVESLAAYKCIVQWSPWSNCDVCGKIGQRRRVGECRLQKTAKAKIKTNTGEMTEAGFPIIGVGCHSYLLEAVPEAKEILDKIPNIVLTEKCEVPCEGFQEEAKVMTAHKKNAFLKKVKMKVIQKMGEVKSSIVTEVKKEKEGSTLALFCPGTTPDTPIRWKYNSKLLDSKKIKERTRGRITIDATDTLHLRNLRQSDSGEYICTLYDVEVGIIRLFVLSVLAPFDWTTNFGILTISLAVSFSLYLCILSIKFRAYKMQKQGQKQKLVDLENAEDKDVVEEEAIITNNDKQ